MDEQASLKLRKSARSSKGKNPDRYGEWVEDIELDKASENAAGEDGLAPGLLRGMREPALARALRAMHSDVRGEWTVAELASLAGMSRSAFAARFSQTLGCAPMEYLSRWRMALAQDSLSRGVKSLDRLAEEIGYESASAFSTAFRRRLGCSPGAFARSRRLAQAN